MAKIALELERALARRAQTGSGGQIASRTLAEGWGWTVADVLCTSGPQDRSFVEQHAWFSIAIVARGSFQYRAASRHDVKSRRELMTPGSLLLGNPEQYFECGHEHGIGDRCLSFRYSPEYFECLAADAGIHRNALDFRLLRVPPLRSFSPLVARALTGLAGSAKISWEELSVQLAVETVQLVGDLSSGAKEVVSGTEACVARVIRMMEHRLTSELSLGYLAKEAGLSSYHFLRTFERLTGLTPHQYVLRARLREAAIRLIEEPAKILDIVLDCGFGDVSNFNRAFRAEFGVSPRRYRKQARS